MITSFKLFERFFTCITPDREIKVGDYAKIYSRDDSYYGDDFNDFLIDHIGIVSKVNKVDSSEYQSGDSPFYINFLPNNDEDISHLEYQSMGFEEHEISVSASSRDELESILLSIKYNI